MADVTGQRSDAVILVGNPRRASRTTDVARALAEAIRRESDVVELADFGARLHDVDDGDVADAVARFIDAPITIVASPTYKGTYTGLLKLFLERVAAGDLAGNVSIPVMLGATPAHAFAVDIHLRTLLRELGASTLDGLFVLESELDRLDEVVARWAEDHRRLLA